MRITIIGAGYVGLVTGGCLAQAGNEVVCVDVDERKIDLLTQGIVPIYEPGLTELIEHNCKAGRLTFTSNLAPAARLAKIVFLAVGTPPSEDGSADLGYLLQAVRDIAPHLGRRSLAAIKSTAPVGTNARVTALLRELTGRDCDVVSNPEFLKEGAAIEDFLRPDRVIVGVRRSELCDLFRQLYGPFLQENQPFLSMSPESAEMSKYVANALLATKISFINEVARICERLDADINDVRSGIGHDRRIGFDFLSPGAGYGGSCFPKDVRALEAMAASVDAEADILSAVMRVNERQRRCLVEKVVEHFGDNLAGITFALWGLAFKPGTDDMREAPSLTVIDQLLSRGADLVVYDPEAMPNARRIFGNRLTYSPSPLDALRNVDALIVVTEWEEFRTANLATLRQWMRQTVIFDGRNLFDPRRLAAAGFVYYSVGRRVVGHSCQRRPVGHGQRAAGLNQRASRAAETISSAEPGDAPIAVADAHLHLWREPHGA